MKVQKSSQTIIPFAGIYFVNEAIPSPDTLLRGIKKLATEKEIIQYYNQRGATEKLFDILNNDFGRKHLPCADMNHNTVYLILTAMAKNFYSFIPR